MKITFKGLAPIPGMLTIQQKLIFKGSVHAGTAMQREQAEKLKKAMRADLHKKAKNDSTDK